MKTRNKILAAGGLAVVMALLYVGWVAYRAHSNLVTLNVRNMDVRQVVKKIEWQTWENIFVHKDVQGQVTLAVHQAPIEKVLQIIADQTSSRSSVIYPLYSSGKSYVTLKKALRGEINPAENGWTNLQSRASFRGGPGGMFGAQTENPKQRVSLQFQGKDVPFVTLALDRFAQARVVPEDGTEAKINLTLKQATVSDAVAQLAKKAHRSWAKLYVLRGEFGGFGGFAGGGPGFGGGGPGQFGGRGTNGPSQFGPRGGGTNQGGFGRQELTEVQRAEMDKRRQEMRKQREDLEEELKKTLPAEERQKRELAEAEREKLMKEMQAMTPEQRMQKFSQMVGMGGASMDLRNRERLLNSTPEQRARAVGSGRGGPGGGGPGRGGPGRGGSGRGGSGGPAQ